MNAFNVFETTQGTMIDDEAYLCPFVVKRAGHLHEHTYIGLNSFNVSKIKSMGIDTNIFHKPTIANE